jgi:outer membrane protein assembly factor BamB
VCTSALLALVALPTSALAAVPAWTTYHHDDGRSGVADGTFIARHPVLAWKSTYLDGPVYAEPLVLGSLVFVVTENDSIYALDAETGHIDWKHHVGTPVPQISVGMAGCNAYPEVGITSTPVIDAARGEIFTVADTWDGHSAHFVLYGFSILDGRQMLRRSVDVPGPDGGPNPNMYPLANLQRESLALDHGEVVFGFGSSGKDCDDYHGWVVASSENGTGPLYSYVTPSESKGGIWNGGGAPVVAPSGNLFVTTGNAASTDPAQYDEGNSIVELTRHLQLVSTFAPVTWATDNHDDLDLGSANAVVLPDGLLFQAGKNGVGYLVSSVTLGGIGGQLYSETLGPAAYPDGGGSYGGSAYADGTVYVPFQTGLFALRLAGLGTAAPSFSVLWHETTPENAAGKLITDGTGQPSAPNGPPIVAGGLVWTVFVDEDDAVPQQGEYSRLFGLDPRTGAVAFSAPLPNAVHFTTPSAAGGRLFVEGGQYIYAFSLTSLPTVAITTPSADATISTRSLTVKGTAAGAGHRAVAYVYVDGTVTRVAPDGSWSATIKPQERGRNTIYAVAVERNGASGDTEREFTYSP